MLKLYYASGTCALASHIVLEQSGAAYEAERIDFSQNAQRSPEYLRLNPKGRVPALATDRGILTETPAILQFIAQSAPEAQLAPLDDPFELARMNSFNNYLCSTVHVAHAHKGRGKRWADDEAAIAEMKRKVPQTVGDCFQLIEDRMFQGPWVLGDRYSASDAYLFTVATWLEGDSVDPKRFPKVYEHRERMKQHPAVAKVLEAERMAAA